MPRFDNSPHQEPSGNRVGYFNQQAAKQWYLEKANKHRETQNKIAKRALHILYSQLVLSFLSLVLYFAYPGKGSLIAIVINLTVQLITYAVYEHLAGQKEKRLPDEKPGEIETQTTYIQIRDTCHLLMNEMRLSNLHLKIIYIKSDTTNIYTVADDLSITVSITRGMYFYAFGNMKNMQSILAHELGHVLQGDNSAFLVNREALSFLGYVSVATLLFLGCYFYFIINNDWGFPGFLNGFSTVLGGLWLRTSLLRRRSEYLADVASVVFLDSSSILRVVREWPNHWSIDYPTREDRITNLSLFLKRFAVSRLQLSEAVKTT